MLKRYFPISFVLLAYSLLLLHTMIPHHHHDEELTEQHHASNSGDNDHSEIDHTFLAHAFSMMHHDSGSTIVYESVALVKKYSKIHIDKDPFLIANYIAGILHPPPLLKTDQILLCFLLSSGTDTGSLRGPPVPLA